LGSYVVFQQTNDGQWRIVGEVERPPGVPARKGRAKVVRDLLGREPEPNETFAVLPRSEWRNALDHD
jgi:hypothetical protein